VREKWEIDLIFIYFTVSSSLQYDQYHNTICSKKKKAYFLQNDSPMEPPIPTPDVTHHDPRRMLGHGTRRLLSHPIILLDVIRMLLFNKETAILQSSTHIYYDSPLHDGQEGRY
jgi:hypothetical protein